MYEEEEEEWEKPPAPKAAAPKAAPKLVEVPVRAMPPPRRRETQKVEVEFTKLETDHLPARANRGEMPYIIISLHFTGPPCANNGKDALNTPEDAV
eukprot:5441384-Pyramimonas_sp.AAC.1